MGRKKQSKSSVQILVGKDRQARAVGLRKKGLSFAKIGAALGITAAGASKAVDRAIAEMNKRSDKQVIEFRHIAGLQIDSVIQGHWDAGTGEAVGDNGEKTAACPQSARIILEAITRKSKLFGLDAPAKIEATDGTAIEMMRMVSARADQIRREEAAITVDVEEVPCDNEDKLLTSGGSDE